MFRSKKDVDRHVQDIFRKLKNEDERNLRCYNIAKLYYQVGDYESTKRYVSNYLEVREGSAGAHKLLGQALEALGQKEAALAQYKVSLSLEGRQDDLVLKVCELLSDANIEMDISGVRYWVDRADKLFPHHPVVFKLKEKMLSVERPNNNSEDLEALIASELSARPTDVQLRVKLLKHYISKNKLEDAYRHASEVEAARGHRNCIVWYQCLGELLAKCKDSKQYDSMFWIFYISALERYTALSLREHGNELKKTVLEATQIVFNFDQSLTELKLKNFSTEPVVEHMLAHMWGQLHFHLACLLLRKTKREQGSWSEAGRLCAPLLLCALHVTPVDCSAPWALHRKGQLKNQIRWWHREGSFRCSQAGHVLQDYARDDANKLMDRIDKFCTGAWRERIYQRVFMSRMCQQLMGSSYFAKHAAPNPPFRLCSYGELEQYDEISERVYPDSLHHVVWLGVKSRPQKKDPGPHPNQCSHVFPELQFSVHNLSLAAPDSLSRCDIDAFLNAAILCSSVIIDDRQISGFLSPERLPTLPADLTSPLCTTTQEKWWSSAYKMYSKRETLDGDMGEIRQELQRGLEVVRCIGNHGLHPAILVHLARIFHHRAKLLKEKDAQHANIPFLEARCELYWSTAIPLLERLQNNQTVMTTTSKLFNYQGKDMNNAELTNALEEGRLLLAQRLVRDKQYDQAIEALQALKCPEASFQQGQIYKTLADDLVSSMPRESLTSEMRSQHIIMLSKARASFYLTLDRLRSPETNPKHPLNSELCTHISDIENELKRIDPDLWRGDLSRNDCDAMSDDSYSPAPSGIDQPIANAPMAQLSGLGASANIMGTPQRNAHRAPKLSSTPCRPQHQDILDISRNRTEARPSPERLDAQIRQMIHSRDTVMQTIVDQNKALLDSHKSILERLEELRIDVAELKKDNQRQRAHSASANANASVNPNANLEEDLYVLADEVYGEMNYGAAQQEQSATMAASMFQNSYRHPCSQLMYPAAAPFQGYYQGGIPFNDPHAPPIPSLIPPNLFPLPVIYPNRSTKMQENMVQQGLFTQRLSAQLTEMMPPANQPLQMPLPSVTKTETVVPRDAPVNKTPPVNVVITTSDTLPTTAPLVQPTLSVTIPPQYRLGGATTAPVEQPNVPHCYQITMPTRATVLTTVNLPPLSTTLTTTRASISVPEAPRESANLSARHAAGSPNSSAEICETEHDPIPDFAPVIPLPAEVKVTTGEENETTLYCARAKLFRFVDREWKERGVGNVKLLRNSEGKVRLLMRRDQVLKICANHMLRADMELTPMTNNDKAWIWVANDFADEEVKLEKLCIKFKTADQARSFKEHFDEARANLALSPEKPPAKPADKTPDAAKNSASVPVDLSLAGKPAAQKEASGTNSATEIAAADKTKGTGAKTVGGFSFSAKPMQNIFAETTKASQNPAESPKVSPFTGFTFNKSSSKPTETTAASVLSFAKTTAPSLSAAHGEASTASSAPVPAATSQPVAQPSDASNAAGARATLRRPHAPAPATRTTSSGDSVAPEDDESVLFQQRATLQRYVKDVKQWEERGAGQIKILQGAKSGRLRLLMVDEQTSKVCCDHPVPVDTKVAFKRGSSNTVSWSVQGKEEKPVTLAATFKTAEHASQFYHSLLNNRQKTARDQQPADTGRDKSSQKLSELFKPAAGSWECKDCYTRNDASAAKCLACEAPAPSTARSAPSSTAASAKAATQPPLSQLFKPSAGSWECKECYTRNDASAAKCLACEAPSPSAANASSTAPDTKSATQPSLSELFKSPAGSWECKGCYVVNSSSNSYCVACDKAKDPSMPPKPKTSSFNVGTAAPEVTPEFSFGIPKDSAKEGGGGFTFRMPTADDKNATAGPGKMTGFPVFGNTAKKDDAATPTKFTFGMIQPSSTPDDSAFTFGSPGKSFGFQFPSKSITKSPGGGETSEEEVVESDDIHFSPIIPLPDKIEVKTGEEDEEVVYSHRAKLFRFDTAVKEWKERGLGDIKLLRHKETGKLRLIMRRDQILKLCLNHFVPPELEFTAKDEKTWLWKAADYSEGEIEYVQFACRFKTGEIAEGFKRAVETARKSSGEEANAEIAKSPSAQDIQVVFELTVTPEEKAAAAKLQLPENFYAYKRKEDCPGCIGCREPSVPLFPEKTAAQDATYKPLRRPAAAEKPFSFTMASGEASERSAAGKASGLKPKSANAMIQDVSSSTDVANASTATPLAKTGFPVKQTSLKQSAFGNDFATLGDKKTAGFVFGAPPVQSANETSTVTSGTFDQSKTDGVQLDNLKICGPSVDSQGQKSAQTGFGSTTEYVFGRRTQGPFEEMASSGSIFGQNASFTADRKSVFDTAPKTSSGLIKSPSFNASVGNTTTFANNFAGTAKTAPGTPATTTEPIIKTPVFGSKTQQDSQSASNAIIGANPTFGTTGKPSAVFTATPSPFQTNLTFGATGNSSSIFGNSTVTGNVSIFGGKAAESAKSEEGAKAEESVPFLPSTNLTFSTLAAKGSQQQEAFKIDPNFSFAGAGSFVFGSPAVTSPKADAPRPDSTPTKRNGDEEDNENGDNDNEQEHDPHFEPIVPLPDAIEVRTGEEDEEKVFCQRAKLYRYNSATKEWKERGVGEMKILHHVGHGSYRLLLRREQVYKVVCNFLIQPEVEFRTLSTSDRAWVWAGMNHAEDNPCVEELAVKFKTPELARQFKEAIDKVQLELRDKQNQDESTNVSPEGQGVDDEGDEIDEEDEAEEEDDDEEEGWMFEKSATLYERPSKDAKWNTMGSGNLIVYYDSDIFGAKIAFKADESGVILSHTIISMDTSMQIDDNECSWAAIDYALEPPVHRLLKATFSSNQAAQRMYKSYQMGVHYAKGANISEQT